MSKESAGRIAELERQIADLERRLPSHSIPPAMLIELDELEEELEREKARSRGAEENDR